MFTIIYILFFIIRWIIPWIIWPNKRNILSITSLPILVLTYIIGSIYYVNREKTLLNITVTDNTIKIISCVFILSTLTWVIGFFLSYVKENKSTNSIAVNFYKIKNNIEFGSLQKKIYFILFIGIIFIYYSFYKMTFIPLFAENPFQAKYMSGDYQILYKSVAQYYRIGLNCLSFVLLFSVYFFLVKDNKNKRLKYLIISIVAFITLSLTLRRSISVNNILLVLVFFVTFYRGKKAYCLLLFLIFLIYPFGSAFNDIFSYLQGEIPQLNLISILYGLPDVSDQLSFMEVYLNNPVHTYGRTIFGGLIPYHYKWNPATFSLEVLAGDSNVASGGLRLPNELWGYISFGYLGAIVFGLIQGYLTGIVFKTQFILLSKTKDNKIENFLKLLYISFIKLCCSFVLLMVMDNLLLIFLYVFLFFLFTRRKTLGFNLEKKISIKI